ncbi:hypothetical protein HWV62_39958 [Athelia sp. TMB]|nr:hypothetical protein HWV62_39958 [Athelia sp. TMB]
MAPPFTDVRIEPVGPRIRVLFGGKFVVDTSQARRVWEHPYYPFYYFRSEDLAGSYLRPADSPEVVEGQKAIFDLVVGDRVAKRAVTKFATGDVKDLVKIEFGAADAWFEEEEEIFVHPKDPYKASCSSRVDVLQSSKHVVVKVDGVEVANTHQPRLLFETSLRGTANYYSVRLPNGQLAEDVVWWYRNPVLECGAIKGYVAFYDEKVDVWVDGVKQAR